MPSRPALRAFFGHLKLHLIQLNLFNTGSQNETITRNERRSTHVYLVLLIISTIILTLSYSIISYTTTIIIRSPSFTEYSNLIQNPSLQCFCSNVIVKYDKFVQIEPQYHELCQSDFISDEWINHLYYLYEQSWNKSVLSDFRRTGVFQFQTLRSLCQLANDTIKNNLQSFQYTDFAGSELIAQDLFEVQIDSYIRDFIDKIPKTFIQTLRFIQNTTAQSLFMTAASVTSVLPVLQNHGARNQATFPYPGIEYMFKDGPSCVCSSSTATHCMGLTIFENEIVSGFQTGCYMLSALMNSTLEAFYNQTFVDKLSNPLKSFQKLNSSNPNDKIEMLIDEMFVKVWSNTTSFEKYFQNCALDLCSYTISQSYSFWNIMIILLGLLGGLTSVFTILSPILVVHIWPIIRKFIFRRQVLVTQSVTVETRPINSEASSICMKIKRLFQFIKKTLINLNLFESIPPSQDESILRQQRYQTRLYMILLLLSLIITTVSVSMNSYTVNVTIKNPSSTDFIKLYDQYQLTLNCPCNQTRLEYNQFIFHLKPQYYEICLSEFVSSHWIDFQLSTSPTRPLYTNDIQYQSPMHFQLLSTLFHVANQTVHNNLQSFYQTKFITNKLLTSSSFQTQIDLIIEKFKRTLPETYQRTLQLIIANAEINQFVVPLNSRFKNSYPSVVFMPAANIEAYRVYNRSSTIPYRCVFLPSNECVLETIISNGLRIEMIPGMFQTVFPLRSVLLSTLECFYNETCVRKITHLLDSIEPSANFSTLNLSMLTNPKSQYDQIGILADKLFIQSWTNHQISYESYFNQCHPLTCQYNYESRFNISYIITTIVGLSGGLSILLQLLLPFFIKILFNIWYKVFARQRTNNAQSISIRQGFRDTINYIKKTMRELNLFPTIPPTQDLKILRRNRRLTRIYLILLVMFVYILAVYTLLTQETISVIVNNPPLAKYSELFNQYHLTLKCSCSHIAVKYAKFITQMEPQFHPICSNALLMSNIYNISWPEDNHPELGFNHNAALHFDDGDFRLWVTTQLKGVSTMCKLSRDILNASLTLWFQRDLITGNIISPIKFDEQTEALMNEFKRTTASDFMQTFDLIQVTNFANQLATTQSSNWQLIGNYGPNFVITLLALPKIYKNNNCSCALQSNCSQLNSFPYRTSNQSLRQILPGFRSGCFSFDALLQSNFACFYNQTCLYLMQTALYHFKSVPFQRLNISSLSNPNQTIKTILNQLFVEEWIEQRSFERYYNECAPRFCQYSYSSKFNQVYFVTTVIAVFGGLTKSLRFVIPLIALILIKILNYKKKNQVIPHANSEVVDLDNHTSETIANPPITIIENNTNPVQEQLESSKERTKRVVMICGCSLVIIGIVIVSVKWFRSANNEYMSTTEPTTSITNMMIVESTTTASSTESCYMTLTYQSEAYSVGYDARSLVLGDFNQDSILDLAVTNYGNHTVSILFGNENGTFRTQNIYSTGDESYPWGITSGDFDNDTRLDIAITLSRKNEIAIFFNIISNGLFDIDRYIFMGTSLPLKTLHAIEAVDLDGNGFTDLVIGSYSLSFPALNSLFVLLNRGNGREYSHFSTDGHTISDIESLVIDDFNNDGKQNEISVCSFKSKVTTVSDIQYNHIGQAKYKHVENRIFGKPQSMIRGRFNDDELVDLALVSRDSDTLHILLAFGNGIFFQQIYHTHKYPVSVTTINWNNDSIDDLAILSCNETITIYRGTKLGIFYENENSFYIGGKSSDECFRSLRSADINQDGKDDLVFNDPNTQTIRVLLGTNCKELQ